MEEAPKKIDGRQFRKKVERKKSRSPQWVQDLVKGPEMKAKRLEGLRKWREAGNKAGRLIGQPDGMRRSEWKKILARSSARADKAIQIMADKNIWVADNDVAGKAMKSAIEIMDSTGEVRLKLAAAKTILDFTQTKPVVKNETTVKTAEDFLTALLAEEGDKDGAKS